MNNEQNTIDLKDLFYVLLRKSWLIILITAIFGVGVGVYTEYGLSKKYESNTLITVTTLTDETKATSDLFRVGTELAKRYSIIAKSDNVIEKVRLNLMVNHNLDIPSDVIKNSFTVQSVNETDILKITVTYTSAEHAQKIADAVTDESQLVYKAQYLGTNVSSIDKADLNPKAVSPNFNLNVIIGVVLGGMLSVGIVLIMEFMNRKIKSEKDIVQYLNIPYFGSIPDIRRMKNV